MTDHFNGKDQPIPTFWGCSHKQPFNANAERIQQEAISAGHWTEDFLNQFFAPAQYEARVNLSEEEYERITSELALYETRYRELMEDHAKVVGENYSLRSQLSKQQSTFQKKTKKLDDEIEVRIEQYISLHEKYTQLQQDYMAEQVKRVKAEDTTRHNERQVESYRKIRLLMDEGV